MPDISPDWSAPGVTGATQITSWVLAIALVLSILALILAFTILGFKGLGHQGLQQFAGKALTWVIAAVVFLGSVNTVWHLAYTFKLF